MSHLFRLEIFEILGILCIGSNAELLQRSNVGSYPGHFRLQ